MPTADRRRYVPLALSCFEAQTYRPRELIVLDDGGDSVEDLMPPWARYYRLDEKLSIPEKRNACCKLARGSVIMHFDDDDWSAAGRMASQVRTLKVGNVSMTGYHSMMFWDEEKGQAYRYQGLPNYAIGTSLAFLKAFWRRFAFPQNYPLGSDNEIVRVAADKMALRVEDAGMMMVARIHAGTSNPKNLNGVNFAKIATHSLPEGFRACIH